MKGSIITDIGKSFKGIDVISIRNFSRQQLEFLFETTDKIRQDPKDFRDSLRGKKLTMLFLEPSTRTASSFEESGRYLGCTIDGVREPNSSSLAKGETLNDTIKMFEGYGSNCFVIRHEKSGSARFASEVASVPVVNAGDGNREHPTQAMLDLYTIGQKLGKLDGISVGVLGDLRYSRTAPSLSYALTNYDAKLFFIAPDSLQIQPRVERELNKKGTKFQKLGDPKEVMDKLDVLYVTRIQKERFPDPTEYEKVRGSYVVDEKLVSMGKKGLGVMHPLPRVDELKPEVDKLENAWYFEQAKNGTVVRAALLYLILGDKNS